MKKTIVAGTLAVLMSTTLVTAPMAEATAPLPKRTLKEQAMLDKWWALHAPIGERKIVGTSPASTQIHGNESASGSSVMPDGIICKGRVENRHRSKETGGLRPRLRIKCTGPETGPATVRVKVFGHSVFAAASSSTETNTMFESRGSTNGLVKVVTVNGDGERFVLNHRAWPTANIGTGHWRTTATWQIISPVTGTIGSSADTSWAAL